MFILAGAALQFCISLLRRQLKRRYIFILTLFYSLLPTWQAPAQEKKMHKTWIIYFGICIFATGSGSRVRVDYVIEGGGGGGFHTACKLLMHDESYTMFNTWRTEIQLLFFILLTWIWLISSLLLLPLPLLLLSLLPSAPGSNGYETEGPNWPGVSSSPAHLLSAASPTPSPLHLPPLPILIGSQTTLHFCGGVSLASVQQGQMPFHFLAFDRCPALSSVSPSPRSLTGHHFPSLTAPPRFKGWDWQWLESEYIFTELIHQQLISGRVQLINSERCTVKKNCN